MTGSRPGGPPKRRDSSVRPRQVIVLTEGERTEPSYVTDWARQVRGAVIVSVYEKHGTPMTLVKYAVEIRRAETLNQKRGRGRAYDEIWCVFDRDEHPQFNDALGQARQAGISLAVSNPCVELWFLLHFEEQSAEIHRHDAQNRAYALLGCQKSLSAEALKTLRAQFEDAANRAKALDRWHEQGGSPPASNPSSGMWRLIEAITEC